MQDITLDLNTTEYEPGGELSGQVAWDLGRSPKIVTVSVGWYTKGRGTEDQVIEWQQEWKTDESGGIESFYCQIPEAPLSYVGKLIEIIWYVSAETKKGRAHTQTEIIVGRQGQVVRLA